MSISIQRRPAWGLGLSLLAHAAVIAWLALRPASMPPADAPAPAMQVRLLLQPVPRVQPPPVSDPPPLPRARTSAAARTTRHAAPAEAPQSAVLPAPGALPVQDAPTAADAAPTQPDASFEMQAARGTARAWVKGEGKGRGGADGQGAPFRPTLEERLGQGIERARRPDCRNAYAGMGVLAVIPLAASAVTGKGCKW